jgi:hypothetical protein
MAADLSRFLETQPEKGVLHDLSSPFDVSCNVGCISDERFLIFGQDGWNPA